jgi:hypothetical protein
MNKPVAIILLGVGVLMFLVFLTADATGIGEGTGVGWKQITGAVFGIVIAAAGVRQLRRTNSEN